MFNKELVNEKYVTEIEKLLSSALSGAELAERLEDYHDCDVARALEDLSPERRAEIYGILGSDRAAEIFAYFDEPSEMLGELPADEAAGIVDCMDGDEALDALAGLGEERGREIISRLSGETRGEMRMLASYGENEIGSLMTTNYIAVKSSDSVKQAMRELIEQSAENDNIGTIYAVGDDGRYCGAIELKELILAREYTPLSEIIMSSYPAVRDRDEVDSCMDWIRDYEEDSIPVLDAAGRIVGAVTAEELLEYMEDESREVYNKLAGISGGGEDEREGVAENVRKRLPWLALLLVLGLGVSGVVGVFESLVAQIAILVSFQSLVLDMAGNVGTQSMAVTVRALVSGETDGHEALHLILREMRIGLVNGLILGAGAFAAVGIYVAIIGHGLVYGFAVSGCVALALVVAMAASGLIGAAIPLFFAKMDKDPAVASGPLITTVNDLVAVVSYYGLAWLLLAHLPMFS